MCPRISVTSNQSRPRKVRAARPIAPLMASSTPSDDVPTTSVTRYVRPGIAYLLDQTSPDHAPRPRGASSSAPAGPGDLFVQGNVAAPGLFGDFCRDIRSRRVLVPRAQVGGPVTQILLVVPVLP